MESDLSVYIEIGEYGGGYLRKFNKIKNAI
jgi:hypothetical protein